MALVELNLALPQGVHLSIEGGRDMQVGMFRPREVAARLPVIDEKLTEVVIKDLILVQASCYSPPGMVRARFRTFRGKDRAELEGQAAGAASSRV